MALETSKKKTFKSNMTFGRLHDKFADASAYFIMFDSAWVALNEIN